MVPWFNSPLFLVKLQRCEAAQRSKMKHSGVNWDHVTTTAEYYWTQMLTFFFFLKKKKKKAQTQLKSSESSNPLQYDSICLRLSDKELAKYREERERISRDRSVNSLCKKKKKKGVIDTDFRSLGDFVEASSTVGTFNRRTRSGFLVLGCLAPHPPPIYPIWEVMNGSHRRLALSRCLVSCRLSAEQNKGIIMPQKTYE